MMYKDIINKIRKEWKRGSILLLILVLLPQGISGCGLFNPAGTPQDQKESESGSVEETSSESTSETVAVEETTLDKTKLPPEPVVVVDPATGESTILETPSFANLAEQESYVKEFNEQFLQLELGGEDSSTEEAEGTEPSAETQAQASETKVTEQVLTADPNGYLLLHQAEGYRWLVLHLSADQDEELTKILEDTKDEAIKREIEPGPKSTLALSNGTNLYFNGEAILNSLDETQEFLFTTAGGVYSVPGSHLLPRRLFEIVNLSSVMPILDEIRVPEETAGSGPSVQKSWEAKMNLYAKEAVGPTSLKLMIESFEDEDYVYTQAFTLAVLKDGHFETLYVDGKMPVIGSLEYRMIRPGEQIELEQNWQEAFGELPRGVYRMEKQFAPMKKEDRLKMKVYDFYFVIP